MKLQNTLFIVTAICFYILLCSKPTDTLNFWYQYEKKNDDKHNIVCLPYETSENLLRPRLISSHFGKRSLYCMRITDGDADTWPKCDGFGLCKDSRTCYDIFRRTPNPIHLCIDPSEIVKYVRY